MQLRRLKVGLLLGAMLLNLLGAMGATLGWNDGTVAMADQIPKLSDDLLLPWPRDSSEDRDKVMFLPLTKEAGGRLRDLAAIESVKRWLHSHVLASPSNNNKELQDTEGALTKRNGVGYMCHFKLCQLGVSGSGKRRLLSSTYE